MSGGDVTSSKMAQMAQVSRPQTAGPAKSRPLKIANQYSGIASLRQPKKPTGPKKVKKNDPVALYQNM
jgi:hypothetical protein